MSFRIQVNQNDEVTVVEEGGGDPIYVETINGTLENPFGTYEKFLEVHNGVVSGDISAHISFAYNFGVYVLYASATANGPMLFSFYQPPVIGNGRAGRFIYQYSDATFSQKSITVKTDNTWSDLTISPTTSTTLTIIHHPLPKS